MKGPAEAADLARAVRTAPGLLLAGVAGFEGVRPNRRDTTTLSAVDEHCHRTITVFRNLTALFETTQPVFSMGGSAFPDRVVHALANAVRHPGDLPMVPVLRSSVSSRPALGSCRGGIGMLLVGVLFMPRAT
ncbi:hypothetical protein ACFQ2K_51695 [Streptomyces sanglieri]|uniref:Uncharacterized protein n=1 Tax=Streptomyces sanglieri TaxID=193460 RepID=A0ABW2XB31_9ACTN